MDAPSADLRSLLDRLKGAQHALIDEAARQPGLPSTAIIRRIAEIENAIAAVLALTEEPRAAGNPVCLGSNCDLALGWFIAAVADQRTRDQRIAVLADASAPGKEKPAHGGS